MVQMGFSGVLYNKQESITSQLLAKLRSERPPFKKGSSRSAWTGWQRELIKERAESSPTSWSTVAPREIRYRKTSTWLCRAANWSVSFGIRTVGLERCAWGPRRRRRIIVIGDQTIPRLTRLEVTLTDEP